MNDAIISSPNNPTIKLIRSLASKKNRLDTGLFVAEGELVLERARAEGWEPDYLLATRPVEAWGEARRLIVDGRAMAGLSSQANTSPILAAFRHRWQPSVAPEGTWLALENIRDPGNLGTIIRTADALALSGVILVGQFCDPWGPECVRATMGSIFGIPLVQMSLTAFTALCRIWPGEVAGTHLHASLDFRRTYTAPRLIVMGSEGTGLSEEAAAACSILVRIPMPGKAQSFNVAVATALILYEAVKP